MQWIIIQITRKIHHYLKRLRRTCQHCLESENISESTFVNWQFWKKIDWYAMSVFIISWWFIQNKYITVSCETAVRDECICDNNRCIRSIHFKKLSSESRTNCWKLYEVCADVVRLLNVLSTCVLRTSAQLSEIDVKELSDVNWMSVRLKKNCNNLYDQINVCINHSEQKKSAERSLRECCELLKIRVWEIKIRMNLRWK
jgi:hypothetical protein